MADFVLTSLRLAIITIPLAGCVSVVNPNLSGNLPSEFRRVQADPTQSWGQTQSREHSIEHHSKNRVQAQSSGRRLARGQSIHLTLPSTLEQGHSTSKPREGIKQSVGVRPVAYEIPIDDSETETDQECVCSEPEHVVCEQSCVHPIDRLKSRIQMLKLPLPSCYQKWQARRNLPDGPERASFHPLPTRPMFHPSSGGHGLLTQNGKSMGFPFGECCYGQIRVAPPEEIQSQALGSR